MRDVVVIGTGGVGRALVHFLHDANKAGPLWRLVGFMDDDVRKAGMTIHGTPVLGPVAACKAYPDCWFLPGIGDPFRRMAVFDVLRAKPSSMIAGLLHPDAYVADNVPIGEGTVVYPGARIDPDVTIGTGVLINQNATLGHDTVAGDFSTIAPGANIGGAVRLGEASNIGIGASVIQGISIGARSIVGAGAAVIRDVPAATTVAGVPARPLARRT